MTNHHAGGRINEVSSDCIKQQASAWICYYVAGLHRITANESASDQVPYRIDDLAKSAIFALSH
ncbi:MAG TPA: hypothetical protein EYN91_21445 [Candidatus Melainabacteria bacterium]|nr:hypothetical protein [Candidatus Melainabacteria bacterium]HIN66476.1 hypothetical protein [Candidatus Obscuribacterales bacterium]